MKFKLDENLGDRFGLLLREDGHDVTTVRGQGIGGIDDVPLIAHCHDEGRCLVTLDRGFSDPTQFKPSLYSGIVLLRLPGSAKPVLIEAVMATLARALVGDDPTGRLWIIEPGRARKYQPLDVDAPPSSPS